MHYLPTSEHRGRRQVPPRPGQRVQRLEDSFPWGDMCHTCCVLYMYTLPVSSTENICMCCMHVNPASRAQNCRPLSSVALLSEQGHQFPVSLGLLWDSSDRSVGLHGAIGGGAVRGAEPVAEDEHRQECHGDGAGPMGSERGPHSERDKNFSFDLDQYLQKCTNQVPVRLQWVQYAKPVHPGALCFRGHLGVGYSLGQ